MSAAPSRTLSDARKIKAAFAADGEEADSPPAVPIPVTEWYAREFQHIDYLSIAHEADRGYEAWLKMDHRIPLNTNVSSSLVEWVRNVPEEELASRIAKVPRGLDADDTQPAFDFTPFQLLSISVWADSPCNVHAAATISLPMLHEMALYRPHDARRRTPLESHFARLKGLPPHVTLVDLPTAAGKTSWALAAAAVLLSPDVYPLLRREAKRKKAGDIFQGTTDIQVARLALVATGGSTFDHFHTTLLRLLPVLRRMHRDAVRYEVWSSVGKRTSVEQAHRRTSDGRTVVFWCLPVSELNKVLRQSPDIAVAMCITDEYTVDTPREKSGTSKSEVLKHVITQATPQALVDATKGNRSWLKEYMGGALHAPSEVHRLIREHAWTEAQLALDQACKLQLMSLTAFRDPIRRDLRALMPDGMDVHMIRSRVQTMLAHATRRQVDLVPVPFVDALTDHIRASRPDLTLQSAALLASLADVNPTPADIQDVLRRLEFCHSHHTGPDAWQSIPVVQRLVTRVGEFAEQCPICWSDAAGAIRVCGGCGYCVCDTCFRAQSRCAFCRKPTTQAAQAAQAGQAAPEDEAAAPHLYPARPALTGANVREDVAAHTSPQASQLHNTVMALHVLYRHGYNRPLILVESLYHGRGQELDLHRLSQCSGYRIERVDDILGGKGTAFAKIKAEFDDASRPPMAMICFGMDARFLVGTDLGHADAVLSVGNIDAKVLTQSLGRVFRPVLGRADRRPVQMIKVYTGQHALRRRPREEE